MTSHPAAVRLDPVTAEAVPSLDPAELSSLRGRTALVTGAGGGIGQWLAAGLGAAGATVVLTDVDPEALSSVQATLGVAGLRCSSVVADLTDDDAADGVVERAVQQHGSLDVLVNCAGINRREAIFDVQPAVFDRIVAVNLRAPYFLARAAARVMARGGRGAIVNIGSVNSAIGLQNVSVYGQSKAAIAQLTKVMAVEWAHLGIRVNCLAPGFVTTPLSAALWENPRLRAWILSRVPQRRAGLPRELVGACVLLASDAGSFITGQTVYVDGGLLAGSPWSNDAEEI